MVISALYAPAGEQGDGLFVSVPLQMNKGIETKEPSPRLLFGIMGMRLPCSISLIWILFHVV